MPVRRLIRRLFGPQHGIVVTFTTIPPRFALLGPMIAALAAQKRRPDAVELYVPRQYRRFPGERAALPSLPDWIDVIETDMDYGPATKVLPALDRWAGTDVDILFCDDDTIHDPFWTTRLAEMRRDRPTDVVCELGMDIDRLLSDPSLSRPHTPTPRAVIDQPTPAELSVIRRRMKDGGPGHPYLSAPGYVDILFGFRGAMVRPGWVDRRAWTIPGILWTVDDVWLSGMIALAGRRIWAGGAACWMSGESPASRTQDLYSSVIGGADRATANRLGVSYMRDTWGIWR